MTLSPIQITDSSYEWSDGTKYDFYAAISDLEEGSGSKRQSPNCVFVTPTGQWMKTSCNNTMDGAICYTTTFNTPTQSKTLICFLFV